MDAPPAKRQRRRLVHSSSDGDEEYNETKSHNTRQAAKNPPPKAAHDSRSTKTSSTIKSKSKPKPVARALQKTSKNSSNQSTPNSSPEKARYKSIIDTDSGKSRSLHSFFGKATERQRWERVDDGTHTSANEDLEDEIEDDLVDDAPSKPPKPSQDHKTVLHRRKNDRSDLGNGSFSDSVPSGSHKFKKPSLPPVLPPSPRRTSSNSLDNLKPWTDEYSPCDLSELVVHKKKVSDVQTWLADAFAGRNRQSILILKGPAGTGKTSTISLLSQSMGFEIKEWRNPGDIERTRDGPVSMNAQFEEFLNRSGKFNTLDLTDTPARSNSEMSDQKEDVPRITLVEEFPSVFTSSSNSSQGFRSSILRFLASNTPSNPAMFDRAKPKSRQNPPLVLIVSETLLTSSFASTDSFTAFRLLGPEITNHPGACVMEFNPVAPTYISKAIELVLKKEARKSGRRRIPGPAVLKKLSESGDVRSAIGSLEFMCLRGDDQSDWGGRIAAKLKKSDMNGIQMTAMERESLEMVTQREASLGIFHAVGKVVWNKRQEPEAGQQVCHPPDHLVEGRRPKVSEVSVEELIDETGTDTQTFISALHENFVLSCDGSSFTECYETCIDALSESDLLNLSSYRGLRSSAAGIGTGRSMFQGTSIDSLRQDEASFQVAVRGLLFNLPYPVRRGYGTATSAPANERQRRSTFQMFFPVSSKLWKHTEETEGLLSSWIDQSMRQGFSVPGSKKLSGVETWKSRNNNSSFSQAEDVNNDQGSQVVRSSRSEVLLETLPYAAKITRQRPLPPVLEKLTKFHGIEGPNEDILDGEIDDEASEPPTTPSKRGRRFVVGKKRPDNQSAIPVESEVEKLILSDDDIEDD